MIIFLCITFITKKTLYNLKIKIKCKKRLSKIKNNNKKKKKLINNRKFNVIKNKNKFNSKKKKKYRSDVYYV